MNDYPNLKNLLGGYFHQDWMEYGSNSEAILQQYFEDEWPIVDVSKATDELEVLLKLPDNELVTNVVSMGCQYYPIGLGLSYREWLNDVANRLKEHIVLEVK